MIVSQTFIIVMESSGLEPNGVTVAEQSLVKVALFEEREPQVVVSGCAVSLHFHCLLQIIYGRLEVLVAESSVANAFIESCLVDIVWV